MVRSLCINTSFVSSYSLEQRMKSFKGESLLNPRNVLKKLKPEDDKKRMEAEKAIEIINLESFIYSFLTGIKTQECLDSFFKCMIMPQMKIIERDVKLYFQLRSAAYLRDYCTLINDEEDFDRKELLHKHFALNLSHYGEHLADKDNGWIVLKYAHMTRLKMKREADALVQSESNQVYMPHELVAYLRERIDRLFHPERFEELGDIISDEQQMEAYIASDQESQEVTVNIERSSSAELESSPEPESSAESQSSPEPEPSAEPEGRRNLGVLNGISRTEIKNKNGDVVAIRREYENENGERISVTERNVRFGHTKRMRWEDDEVKALERAIAEVGPKWIKIKEQRYPELENKTNVQLRDKARGELRRRKRLKIDLGVYASLQGYDE
ncbi:hypothetical protein RMATCC62417_17275 [Rhizopus microsporus]|nr:hypothetical protein RMATCC62417_17275 [Rhizopus microsporus]